MTKPPSLDHHNGAVDDIDVARLRRETRERALSRPRVPFEGSVEDGRIDGVAVRSYSPADLRTPYVVVFLHGGYGLFGDLDGQDSYCRLLATGLTMRVVSVDYTLAPEGTLDDAAADTVTVVERLGASQVLLCGDSAGGAVALRAAQNTVVAGLLLTNPNVDLSLARFDDAAPGGPDRATAAWSFARWAPDSPDLAAGVVDVPPVLVAVGDQDALLAEARYLVEQVDGAVLLVLSGKAHGFMGDAAVATGVIVAMREFLEG